MSLGALAKSGSAKVGGLLGLNKAKLNVYKPIVPPPAGPGHAVHTGGRKAEKSYEFDYNPKEINFASKAVIKTATTGNGTEEPQRQVVGAEASTLTFELFYSIFEVGDLLAPKLQFHDLVKLKNELLALTRPHPSTVGSNKTPSPPLVDFSWGDLITDPALVQSVAVTYTHMLADGTPVRLSAKVELTGTMKEKKGTNPTSGGRTNRKTHTLLAGETLASVAYSEFNDAGLWRAIAEENEIDDPMRMKAGAVLLLPSFEE
jgi:hypothetical protein